MRSRPYFNPQFLPQFTRQPIQRRLPRLQLPAGKLPTTRKMLTLRPLRDQHPIRRVDHHAGNDVDDPSTRILGNQPLACCRAPWQCLYLRPDPQGQGSLRPTLGI